jgi:hypothetical protein
MHYVLKITFLFSREFRELKVPVKLFFMFYVLKINKKIPGIPGIDNSREIVLWFYVFCFGKLHFYFPGNSGNL